MQLTDKQNEAVKIAVERYRHKKKYTVISGYAGSGKTTLVSYIIAELGVDEDYVVYCAYTGKACQVLVDKGNTNVLTLHKLLYEFIPKPDGTFRKKAKRELDYKVVVVDECSMVPGSFVDLLLSHDVYVIFCGDPFQLPPVSKEDTNDLLEHPHIFLDEIMRQEEESEIVQLTMDIRNQRPLRQRQGKEVQIINRNKLNTGMLEWADQILVATNKTRVEINKQMRALKGIEEDWPQEGDKVICLRNYWGELSNCQNDLINGTIGFLKNKYDTFRLIPKYCGGGKIDVTTADFVTDTGEIFKDVEMDTHMIITGEKCVTKAIAYRLESNPRTTSMVPHEFTYGYAITVHKSQGSQWPNILVIEEQFPFNSEEHARWLYTACSRAEQKLVLVR